VASLELGAEQWLDFYRIFTIGLCFVAGERISAMSFEEALAVASRDEGFKATVYAMNTLLIHKGIYTQGEFRALFVEWVEKEQRSTYAKITRSQL
jgi:hypothetical protein